MCDREAETHVSTLSCYVAKADWKLTVFLAQLYEWQDYMNVALKIYKF